MSQRRERSPSIDRAFLLAVRAFGEVAPEDWERYAPALAGRLRELADDGSPPEAARGTLARGARLQRRPDLERVHPSWIERALREESSAVRRILAARGPEAVRRLVADEPDGLDHEPDPDAVELALALWSERLVGDVPDRDEDASVVVALSRLGLGDLYRLVETIGLLKLASLPPGRLPSLPPREAARLARFGDGKTSEAVAALVEAELREWGNPRRRIPARLGLTTIGRMGGRVDPHRWRWAIQHQPYSIVKATRPAATGPSSRSASVAAWDARLLRRAAFLLADRSEVFRSLA